MILLDTCALLWLTQGSERINRDIYERIQKAPVVYISAISGFEVGLKQRKGKLDLPSPAGVWMETVINHHGLTIHPLTMEICVRATDLPFHHNDPCDRMIIATAQELGIPVVTADQAFMQYDIEVLF
ncbi:MAG: type II toxin-antitoxin system VapC family toxin [Desulfococcaceae bacterium]